MSRKAAIGIFTLLAVLLMGFVAFQSYYFGVWPKPSLTVDDPSISEWLQDSDVIIHRRGFKRPLDNSTMYIQKGQRIDGGCRWHTRLSLQGGEPGPPVARALATNHGTCERLMMEGVLPR